MKNGRALVIFCGAMFFVCGILVGWIAHAFFYYDACLDMGGGTDPGNYPICVIR